MEKHVYDIETTINGYVLKKTKICKWESGKDFMDDLVFKRDGEEVDYYNDIAGDFDDLDNFLKYADNTKCENYEGIDKPNAYLEYWLTDTLGYYPDRYIGLIIE